MFLEGKSRDSGSSGHNAGLVCSSLVMVTTAADNAGLIAVVGCCEGSTNWSKGCGEIRGGSEHAIMVSRRVAGERDEAIEKTSSVF